MVSKERTISLMDVRKRLDVGITCQKIIKAPIEVRGSSKFGTRKFGQWMECQAIHILEEERYRKSKCRHDPYIANWPQRELAHDLLMAMKLNSNNGVGPETSRDLKNYGPLDRLIGPHGQRPREEPLTTQ